jgi:hypothetical protein
VIELYITAVSYGIYLGFWIPFAAGLEATSGSTGSGENLGYSLAMLAGGGLMALAVAGLDSGDGMRTGVAPSMSVGLRYGLGMGFLMWGALDNVLTSVDSFDRVTFRARDTRPGFIERTALPMGFGLGGLVLGAAIGFGASPSTDHVRFVETGGIWGTAVGFLAALAVSPPESAQGFGITAAGLATGVLTTALIASTGLQISPRRSWFLTLGLLAGTAAGAIVPLIATAGTGGFSVQIFGAVAAATSIAGLVAAYLLTEGMDERIRERDAERRRGRAGFDPLRDLRLDVGALDGGGMVSLRGGLY